MTPWPALRARPAAALSLLLSSGTLICCTLPALMVLLGAGSVLAALISWFPGLVVISEHKAVVFGLATAALALAAIPIVSLPGRIAAGWLGDTVDKRKLMAVCLFVEGAGILVLAATTTPLVLAAAVLLFSPAFGGTIPLRIVQIGRAHV